MSSKPRFVGDRRLVDLGSICELVMGQSPSSDTYNADGEGLPFYQGNADFGEKNPIPHVWCTEPKKVAEKGDILVSVRAPIGAINIASEQCCIGRGVAAIRPRLDFVSADFLMHQLLASRKNLELMGTGSTFKAVGKRALNGFAISIYPKGDQDKIADQLDCIIQQIKAIETQVAQLDQLVKSRFVEMFGNCQNRVRLSEVCGTFNGDRGKNYPSGNDRTDEGVPFVNAGHLKNGRVLFDEMDYITEDRYELLSGGKIQRGDLLYCLRGSLGKCAIADFDKGTIASSMMIIRPDRTKILSLYLFQVLTSPDIDRQLKLFENGSSQPNLSAKSVASYLIPLPNLRDQQEFADFVAQIDKSRFIAQQQIEKLQMLYDSLAQDYFGD